MKWGVVLQYLLLFAAIVTGIHAGSYGYQIGQQGNRLGAIGIYGLVMATLSISIYLLVRA